MVELAEFHTYDLSLTDVKEYKIHTFFHTAWGKKSSRHIEILTSVFLLIDTNWSIWLMILPNVFLSTRKENVAVLEGKQAYDITVFLYTPPISTFKPIDRSSQNFV